MKDIKEFKEIFTVDFSENFSFDSEKSETYYFDLIEILNFLYKNGFYIKQASIHTGTLYFLFYKENFIIKLWFYMNDIFNDRLSLIGEKK